MCPHKIALCLGGGGVTGAMYQIGVLAALEDAVEGLKADGFDLYIGASSGASVAAALAGGRSVQRIYRAILDPADDYFPLERKHLLRTDIAEWRRTLVSAWAAFQQGTKNVFSRVPTSPAALWDELDRFADSLPAGFFSFDAYERFLEDFFVRREVPNRFAAMPRSLRIIAYSPVRIGSRHYIDTGSAQVGHIDVAAEAGADVILVVNPMVPVIAEDVPTGHGPRPSLRDKGMFWVLSQANRISMHKLMQNTRARYLHEGRPQVILIEPESTDGIFFMHNPASFAARRSILEYAYRSTRSRVTRWFADESRVIEVTGWRQRTDATVWPPPMPTAIRD